jgi:hypothetical protein
LIIMLIGPLTLGTGEDIVSYYSYVVKYRI